VTIYQNGLMLPGEAMRLGEVEWLLEHSEVTSATPSFVWKFWTDVGNWSDPPATFRIDGPFIEGTRGMTRFPNREPLHWQLQEVEVGSSYTIALEIEGAVLLCHWRFEAVAGGTRLTQRIGLSGPEASRHAEGVRSGFGSTLEPGMKRIALLLSEAQAKVEGGRPPAGGCEE